MNAYLRMASAQSTLSAAQVPESIFCCRHPKNSAAPASVMARANISHPSWVMELPMPPALGSHAGTTCVHCALALADGQALSVARSVQLTGSRAGSQTALVPRHAMTASATPGR